MKRVLFICEDNRYSATTSTAGLTAGPGVSARANALADGHRPSCHRPIAKTPKSVCEPAERVVPLRHRLGREHP